MRAALKTVIFYAVVIAVPLLFFELLAGYYLTEEGHPFKLAALMFIESKLPKKPEQPAPTPPAGAPIFPEPKHFATASGDLLVDPKDNAFLSNPPQSIYVRLHPFLDYTGAHQDKNPYNLDAGGKSQNDFFGFRNSENYYFQPRNPADLFVVMTGGSECAGYNHASETIGQNLQKKLQVRTQRHVIVMNLCMNSYTLANEMQAYLHLAYDLKPDLVITHSGWNDSIYGFLAPKEFLALGLVYNKAEEYWLEPLYGMVKKKPPEDRFSGFDVSNRQWIVDAYWRQIKKYQAITTANGAKFLLGLQGYNPVIASDSMMKLHLNVHKAMEELSSSIPTDIDSINFTKDDAHIHYADSCHSTQASVDFVAERYAEYIAARYPWMLVR